MNRQPFLTPSRRWTPKLTPWIVRMMRPLIQRDLRRQKIREIEIRGMEHVQQALRQSVGVLITPNHSFHYDSFVMMEVSHRMRRPFHYLTAWQVFEMSPKFDQWLYQRHGCYSINREGVDLAALKTSVDILRHSKFPLVIYPEGEIYHHNDRVSAFRDGAAAIALSAAKRSDRQIVSIPCAVKAFYLTDPSADLERLMARLEESLHWRPLTHLRLTERISRFAEGLLALKELQYLRHAQKGSITRRVQHLVDEILRRLEHKHELKRPSTEVPERVKDLRRAVVAAMDQQSAGSAAWLALDSDLEDLFFVVQLFSYPAGYVAERPDIERIAETLDKFEEDVFHAVYPAVRGERKVIVQFGEPHPISDRSHEKQSVSEWTGRFERQVQTLLDQINAHPPAEAIRCAN